MKKIFNDSFKNWIFDLDNTIYDIKVGLFTKISSRITDYIMTAFSYTREEANAVRSNMYKKYGLTLTGLMIEYEINPDEYLHYIHDVTHPELKATFQLQILGVKKNPNGPMYSSLGVMTKGTVIEVSVEELGLVTPGGKVVWGKYAQVTNNPENDGCVNAVLLV